MTDSIIENQYEPKYSFEYDDYYEVATFVINGQKFIFECSFSDAQTIDILLEADFYAGREVGADYFRKQLESLSKDSLFL